MAKTVNRREEMRDTMSHIQVMDPILSNKIAAGEVVERPASVVKELVENAIDAKSRSITIVLKEAGLDSIRVIDDGIGMSRVDAVLSFERHATSKIANEFDLSRIRTLGFRGEALASIAAVSKVEMWTSTETEGTHLQIEGGEIVTEEPAALRRGTDLVIRQLFYNTPARLKHVKTIQTELGHSIDLVNQLALGHPNIAFRLIHNGKTLLQTPGTGDLLRVITAIYGHEIAAKMIPFSNETADYQISGYVALPEVTRASKNYMTLLVNQRSVRSFLVQRSILEGMHTFLPIHRYPIVVLSITTDPQLVDVNVHPSKKEVRFSKENDLYPLIEETLRETIRHHVQIPSGAPEERKKFFIKDVPPVGREKKDEQLSFSPTPASSHKLEEEPIDFVQESPNVFIVEQEEQPKMLDTSDDDARLQGVEKPSHQEEPIPTHHPAFPSLEIVGQVHGTYIIAQNETGMYMIDQHAAQERINYEKFRDALGQSSAEERQMMLMPLIFRYSAAEEMLLKERLPLLQSVGITLEPFGPQTYAVKEYPAWFPKGEIRETIEQIVEQVMTENRVDIEKLREETAILMSCKRSIKANHSLTRADMERLLEDLSRAEHPFTCPHGRPVIIHFSTTDIEKMFKRIM